MSKTLVAFFSASGITRALASRVASCAGADLYEIVPAQRYTAQDLDWRDSESRSSRENTDAASRPAIQGPLPDLAGYDTVLIGFPLWWYKAPRIIQTFLESVDCSGKTLSVFCTSGSSQLGKTQELLVPEAAKANWRPGIRFDAAAGQDAIRAWLAGITG